MGPRIENEINVGAEKRPPVSNAKRIFLHTAPPPQRTWANIFEVVTLPGKRLCGNRRKRTRVAHAQARAGCGNARVRVHARRAGNRASAWCKNQTDAPPSAGTHAKC